MGVLFIYFDIVKKETGFAMVSCQILLYKIGKAAVNFRLTFLMAPS